MSQSLLYTDQDGMCLPRAFAIYTETPRSEPPPLTPFQASFGNPTQIFGDDVTEEKGENARLSAFVGAIAVGDLVKSTLGPKGMDKILQSAYVGQITQAKMIYTL